MLSCLFVLLEPGSRQTLLGRGLNNTEVYLTTILVLSHTTLLQDKLLITIICTTVSEFNRLIRKTV
jgi:hypothetical protein